MKTVALAAALSVSGCLFARPDVDRLVDGQLHTGRYVTPAAYSEYTRGVLLEASGDARGAATAYTRALEDDPDSPELWTRLGKVRCDVGEQTAAVQAFARAQELDAEYAPLHRARAQCALARGDAHEALRHSQSAVRLDPDDDRNERVVLDALERAGNPAQALSRALSHALRRSHQPSAWQRVARLAERAGEAGLAARAQRRAASTTRAAAVPACSAAKRSAIDAALRGGELEAARHLATECRFGPGSLALRAAMLGATSVARRQAELTLDANPSDGDARVAAWLAADAARDPGVDAPVPADGAPPSPLGARLFAELLDRRVGADAARAWLFAVGPLPPPADALERDLDARLKASLGAAR